MPLKEIIQITIKAGKFIGNAKAIKNTAGFVSSGWKEKEKQKQEEKKRQKEREERKKTIKYICNRNIFETIGIYFIGTAAACYIAPFGLIQTILIVLMYLVHMSNLLELKDSLDLRREWVLTAVSVICTLVSCIKNL